MEAERVSSTSPLRQMMRSLRRREKMSAGTRELVSLMDSGGGSWRCTCLVATALTRSQHTFI